MNLKSRIKKIESAVGINRSKFCACYGITPATVEVKPMPISEFNRRFYSGEPMEERLPDFCERCQKPVDKTRIEQTFEQYVEEKEARLNEIWERYRKHQV